MFVHVCRLMFVLCLLIRLLVRLLLSFMLTGYLKELYPLMPHLLFSGKSTCVFCFFPHNFCIHVFCVAVEDFFFCFVLFVQP